MKPLQNTLLATVTALICTACSGPADTPVDASQDTVTADTTQATAAAQPTQKAPAQPGEPVEIMWEELMPQGEEERLEELYAQYYEELEKQFAETATQNASGDDAASTSTQDLVAAITEGSANDTMDQIGTFNVVTELNGKSIRIPGYVVPFDFNAQSEYKEFLLVPYFGACLHTPPPPPNQIVLVKADPAASISDIYEPVWVEGTLTTGEFNSELADTAYELALSKIEAYVY